MFRLLTFEGEIVCESYEMTENGVEMYTSDEEFLGFVPFSNLHVLIDDDAYASEEGEPSIY